MLAQIQIGCSFTRDATSGRYWIKLRAEHSKNNKPVMLPIPDKLTDFFSHYITVARATVIRLAGVNNTGNDKNYVFLKDVLLEAETLETGTSFLVASSSVT